MIHCAGLTFKLGLSLKNTLFKQTKVKYFL